MGGLWAAAWWHPLAPVLLALLELVAAGDPVASRSDRAVGTLVGILLCLVVGLALAWHHLCRLSPGRYHPRPMGRRALAVLRGGWHRLQGRRRDTMVLPGDGEDTTAAEEVVVVMAARDEEEELMPWSQELRPQEEEEEEEQKEKEEQQEEEEEATGSPPDVGQVAEGSTEALLSDLHSFSGTATWGDIRPHVTAL
ncbi:protein tyrosine phosphatase receptor type C-associated protein [Indicator indicator]|uniref:protein tyrosine phosphatase receptor type C-associated protein n=1 Tax=Indicator indicator TaxID=1002788 RepID=UPI0023DFCD8C|nr:protein tyrosine phosphatase receptor type C-associated protein [Indicator indicator]